MLQMNDPRQSAKELLRNSVPSEEWLRNEDFITSLREGIRCHPISSHSAMNALKKSAFGLQALQQIHLDYRHAIVQVFTDALLMAQFQSRQLEPRLQPGAKMYTRFLLALNVLDEFGFKPGTSQFRYYRGNPSGAHYPLYEKVLDELCIGMNERSTYIPSLEADRLRRCLESSFGSFALVTSLLAVSERIVLLFSMPLRENARAVGVKVNSGYYLNHGSSTDPQSEADDDTHENDLWYALAQAIAPEQYGEIAELCEHYCNLWNSFWNVQMHLVTQGSFHGVATTVK